MAVQFGGLASGLDVNGIIDGLMKAERIPLDRIRARQASADKAQQTVTDFSKKLAALKAAADRLAVPSTFASFAATSSDATALAVSVGGAPQQGAYHVVVDALAKETRTYSNPTGSSTTPLGVAGTLRITVGSRAPVDVTVDATDTLASLASKIGSSGARVNASILYDGSSHRLLVRGLDTGVANAVTLEQQGFDLGLQSPANAVQAASDAQLHIDGFAISRTSNQITDVIPGVTLALAKPSPGGVDVQVSTDPAGLAKKIDAFVSAYNDVVTAGHTAAGYGSAKSSSPELSGDGTIRSALSQLAQILYTPVAGTSGKYTSLSSIGLKSKADGTLSFDSTKLSEALTSDPTGVAKLFTVDASIGATGAMGNFRTVVDNLATSSTSPIQARIDGLATLSRRLRDDGDKLEARISKYEERLRAQFTALEKRMSAYQTQLSAVSADTSTTSYKA
jgi:flagellar hook-associated protein 2